MASHLGDDFELIDAQSEETILPTRSKDGLATCSHPSNVAREEEQQSERAIVGLIAVMQQSAAELETKGPFFHASLGSDPNIIFDTFAAALPLEFRQSVNCDACKRFLRQYGDLCVVGEDGRLLPLAFPANTINVPQYYLRSCQAVFELFTGKSVGDEFKLQGDSARTLGSPSTNGWNHMSITLEKAPTARANDSMTSQDTDTSYRMLDRILKENSPEIIANVHHMIHDNQLPCVESHKGPMTYLQDTVEKLKNSQDVNPTNRKNLVTKYARTAFPGCLSSIRSGMIGFLFECVNEGQDFETLKRNWICKADPGSYLRPKAAPRLGNVESAESIFARMGYTLRDLERVYLTLDKVPQSAVLWAPSASKTSLSADSTTMSNENDQPAKPTKLFGNLLSTSTSTSSTKPNSYIDPPIKDISFRHFVQKVLPITSTVEALPASTLRPYFFTTGKLGSKPLMAFHNDTEGSHTASWYAWKHAATPAHAALKEQWTPVKSIITFPHLWDHLVPAEVFDEAKIDDFEFKRHGIRLLFVLEGIKERFGRGLALFPTLMKGEFHSVRKTVEAYSAKGIVEDPDDDEDPVVGGFSVHKDVNEGETGMILRVCTKAGQVSRYRITLFE